MKIPTSIDEKLNAFAKRHNAEIYTREIGADSKPVFEAEIRKILWDDAMFSKAIFIIPAQLFDDKSASNSWSFTINASLNEDRPGEVPFWTKDLLEEVPFQEIEEHIDHLLNEAEHLLAAVRKEDMRLTWGYYEGPDGRIEFS